MNIVITTKYFGPTNAHGSRIKATAYNGSVTIPYNLSLDTGAAHFEAVVTLLNKLGYNSDKIPFGQLPDNSGYVAVVDL